MSQTKDFTLSEDKTIFKTFIRKDLKFSADLHTHMNGNLTGDILIALGIGFVDALPILGSGTVMIPWAIISGLNGELTLGISIMVLLIFMSVTRQLIEPKIVSGNIGIHPIFTIIAMYTGFKIIGVLGMFIGPILLIIFKNIFSNFIDNGIIKSFF